MRPIITLTTDFGEKDGYVGAVKGVLLSICPEAALVDISHGIPPHDIETGAYVISTSARRFPPKTIHLGVVDPGVGTKRRGMILLSGDQVFVGPDNGLFSFALEDRTAAYEIIPVEGVSSTFHGRDLFAPIAAKIASGMDVSFCGPPLEDPIRLPAWAKSMTEEKIEGRIVHIDSFGNAITNITPEDFRGLPVYLTVPGKKVPNDLPVLGTYGEAKPWQSLWLVGSEGRFELAIRDGHAASAFGLRRGDKVVGVLKM